MLSLKGIVNAIKERYAGASGEDANEAGEEVKESLLQEHGEAPFASPDDLRLSAMNGARKALNEADPETGVFISDDLISTLIERTKAKAEGREPSDALTLTVERTRSERSDDRPTTSWIRGGPGGPGREAARELLDTLSEHEQIQNAVDNNGPRGEAVRRAIEQAGRAAQALRNEPSHLYDDYDDAERAFVHHVNVAFHEAKVLAAQQSPVVWALIWQVSPQHSTSERSPDVCDVLAELDPHGLGKGTYFPASCPSLPHDNCHCSLIPQTVVPTNRGKIEYDDDQVPNRWPDELSEGEVAQVMKSNLAEGRELTDDKIKQVTELANRRIQVAHDRFIDY